MWKPCSPLSAHSHGTNKPTVHCKNCLVKVTSQSVSGFILIGKYIVWREFSRHHPPHNSIKLLYHRHLSAQNAAIMSRQVSVVNQAWWNCEGNNGWWYIWNSLRSTHQFSEPLRGYFNSVVFAVIYNSEEGFCTQQCNGFILPYVTSITGPQDAHTRSVLCAYLGSNTLEFTTMRR